GDLQISTNSVGTFSPSSGSPVTLTLSSLGLIYDGGATLGGSLGGTDNFIVTGLFTWNSGTLSGPVGSTLEAKGGISLSQPLLVNSNASSPRLDGRTLINDTVAT